MSGYLNGGLEQKYIITKKNGHPVDPKAVYFVLRLDQDPNAIKAILAYAVSVGEKNPELAFDLFAKVDSIMNGLPTIESLLQKNASLDKQLTHLLKNAAGIEV